MVPNTISGGSHTDHRGTLRFLNEFDMTEVKRFYTITHQDTETRRGWRGHKIEQRWFYVTEGAFEIELVKIDDWHAPSRELGIATLIISANKNEVLHVPVGYATCLRALEINSKVVLFADYGIENAPLDNYLWSNDYFNTKKQ